MKRRFCPLRKRQLLPPPWLCQRCARGCVGSFPRQGSEVGPGAAGAMLRAVWSGMLRVDVEQRLWLPPRVLLTFGSGERSCYEEQLLSSKGLHPCRSCSRRLVLFLSVRCSWGAVQVRTLASLQPTTDGHGVSGAVSVTSHGCLVRCLHEGVPAFVLPDLSMRDSHTLSPLSGPLLSSPAPNKPLPPPPALTLRSRQRDAHPAESPQAGAACSPAATSWPLAAAAVQRLPGCLPAAALPTALRPAARGRGRGGARGRPASGLHGRLGREAHGQQGTGPHRAAARPEAGLCSGSRCCAADPAQPGVCRTSLKRPSLPLALPVLCTGGRRRFCLAREERYPRGGTASRQKS